MKPLKILGIYRLPIFSNNAIEADRLILEESIAQLRALHSHPLVVEMVEESETSQASSDYDLVLTMAQNEDTLRLMENKFPESVVWNSPKAIRNCYRLAMSKKLSMLPVSYVPFQVADTNNGSSIKLNDGESYWLKRSDFHAISDDDVTLVENATELAQKLERFIARGVKEVIVQKHIHGDIYKFYGVKGKFFRAIRVRSFLENPPAPDFVELEQTVTIAAGALDLLVYGGDAILDAKGKFNLIDLNDWPSFRICRDDAAKAIAHLANEHLESLVRARSPAPALARNI